MEMYDNLLYVIKGNYAEEPPLLFDAYLDVSLETICSYNGKYLLISKN